MPKQVATSVTRQVTSVTQEVTYEAGSIVRGRRIPLRHLRDLVVGSVITGVVTAAATTLYASGARWF